MPEDCELVERQSQPALVVRRRAAVEQLKEVLGPAWGAIMQYAGRSGLQPAGPPYVAYHNMDMQDLDIEIGFPFSQTARGAGEVQASEIPGGEAATCLHVGPYEQIGETYQALQTWMEQRGRTAAGAAYEFYLNDPRETPPEALQTQVVFPLAAE